MLIASGQISEAIPQPAAAETLARSGDRTEEPSAFAEEFGKALEAEDTRPSRSPETAQTKEQEREGAPAPEPGTDKASKRTEKAADQPDKTAEQKGNSRRLVKAISERNGRRTEKAARGETRAAAADEAAKSEKAPARLRESGELLNPGKWKLAAKEAVTQTEERPETKEDKPKSERESAVKIAKPQNGGNAVVLGNPKGDISASSRADINTTFASGPESGQEVQKAEMVGRQAVVEVRDYRDSKTAGKPDPQTAETVSKNIEAVESRGNDGEQPAEIRYVRYTPERPSESTPARLTRADSAFTNYVRENLSTEMVKQTGIILRNNNQGEIRLVLKPEELGRVRMRIQLDENRLSGRILVDSGLAKESLEQNLEELYRAFRENGYETGGFEVLVGGQGGQKQGADGDPEQLPAKTLNQLDNAVPILEEIDHQSEMINLVI